MEATENREFYFSILKCAPNPIGIIDIEKNELIYSNGKAEKILGYTVEKFRSISRNNFRDIVHPKDMRKLGKIQEETRKAKDDVINRATIRLKSSTGIYHHWELSENVFERNKEGIPTKYVVIVRDITELVNLKSELAEKMEVLKKVSFKNSHVLRPPVAKILAVGNLLDSDHITQKYTDLFNAICDAVLNLDGIIHEINEELHQHSDLNISKFPRLKEIRS